MIAAGLTKTEVIELFEEANRPLDKESLSALVEVVADLERDGDPDSFVIMDAECRICAHSTLAIIPEIADLDNFKCGNCENWSMQERDIPEWEQE